MPRIEAVSLNEVLCEIAKHKDGVTRDQLKDKFDISYAAIVYKVKQLRKKGKIRVIESNGDGNHGRAPDKIFAAVEVQNIVSIPIIPETAINSFGRVHTNGKHYTNGNGSNGNGHTCRVLNREILEQGPNLQVLRARVKDAIAKQKAALESAKIVLGALMDIDEVLNALEVAEVS
jgi:hypothetical protein